MYIGMSPPPLPPSGIRVWQIRVLLKILLICIYIYILLVFGFWLLKRYNQTEGREIDMCIRREPMGM
jgi:hypothetical protein